MARLAVALGVVEDIAMLAAGAVNAIDGAAVMEVVGVIEGGKVPSVGGCCTRSRCTWRHRRECLPLPPPKRHLLQQ